MVRKSKRPSGASIISVEQFWKEVDPTFLIRPKVDAGIEDRITALDRLVSDLHTDWKLYKQLFARPEERAVLSRSGSVVFARLRWSLADSVLLSIARLADPPKTKGQENLTIDSVFVLVTKAPSVCRQFVSRLEKRRTDSRARAKNFQSHRNKRIAHNDAALLLRAPNSELLGIEIEDVEAMMESVRRFMNEIHAYFHLKHRDYEVVYPPATDGNELLRRLRLLEKLEKGGRRRVPGKSL